MTTARGRITIRLLVVLAVPFGAAGCVSGAGPLPRAAPEPVFDPAAFFAGETHGVGTLRVVLRGATATDVRGIGRVDAAGTITLDQEVVQGGGAPKHRRWQLRPTGPLRYAGTLTDAVGPVVAITRGNMLEIRFTMRHGLKVEQRLFLQPGGRVALNRMTIRKLGIVVAQLDERIEKQQR
ncbi:Protein of unknown function [Sphingomonas palmae]|uniref:DUF3833 family protein n=1 Tax=Sphingomonas palmae TaxID=1855283 RepID=A0A1H7UNE9_9SPHN|nr:DUF3833 family protein [Sphingomonas palmae]SEL97847.1 Protein of unknown function [Sphingomonas palmae]